MARWEVREGIPHKRAILRAQRALEGGGIVLYPTDTTYAIGCLISQKAAFERLCRLKGVRPDKNLFSVFLPSVSAIGTYALGVDTPTYRLLRRLWPGPYTVILRAGPAIPRHLWYRKTIGFRVSAYPVVEALLEALSCPIVTASVPLESWASYAAQVDEVLDAGPLPPNQTTVLDLSEGLAALRVLRQGSGPIENLLPFLPSTEPLQET
ncbi:MAG: L-threonylcarbamoyladenylate synthase [Bacteroidia bacterium]|nr:L-threonylcarbamoyladenylate synthase [Bacteroidia bacterium]MDW8089060.1 L-threonylcarbamoyladenylate synthase [Bacteroidia bacterium]